MHRALSGLPSASQIALQRVINAYQLEIGAVTRRGPRFFVAEVKINGRQAIWKMCVSTASRDRWSAKKFSREIRFLAFLQKSTHPVARGFAPRLFASSLGNRPWYIREFISGHDYSRGGNIRFTPAFFNQKNLGALLRGFRDLQSIRPTELPPALRSSLHRYDTVPHWLKFLRPFWKDINRVLNDPKAGADLQTWIRQQSSAYGKIPTALSHSEPYAPHFIRYANKLRLIDWENINWANPVADATVIWMRADGHPAWQAALIKGWRSHWKKLGKQFDVAWETDLLVRSVFTLLSSESYHDQADIRPLARLAKRIVRTRLALIRSTK